MNYRQFIKFLRKEINTAITDGWLCVDDFDTHRSCDHSVFHSKIIGLLSYVLQYHLSLYVKHEPRPWRTFSTDIIAFRKIRRSFLPVALIEYESPNSYLHFKESHVGKDIMHYFAYQRKTAESTASEYAAQFANAAWYIITTLPKHDVNGNLWRYRKWLGGRRKQEAFMKNPFRNMFPRYKSLFSSQSEKCCRSKSERNQLLFLNISIEKGKLRIERHRL